MITYFPTITGSLTINGDITVTGNSSMSASNSLSSSYAQTASYANNFIVAGSLFATASQALTASYLLGYISPFPFTGSAQITGSFGVTGSVSSTGNITTTGTITAQTLVVQTITSSVSTITGSTQFGSSSVNTHQFTGSVFISSSATYALDVTGAGRFTGNIKVETNGTPQYFARATGTTGQGASAYFQVTGNTLYIGNGDQNYASLSDKLIITSTGGATFSSSVTASAFSGAGTNLTGTAASLSIGGNAATATVSTYMVSQDTRNTASTPQTNDASQGIRFDFKANSTNGLSDGGTYNGAMYFRKYGGGTDFSGGGSHELGFTDSGNIYHRYGTSTSWGSWIKFLDSSNYNSYAVPLTGTTMTGKLTIDGLNFSGNTDTLYLTNKRGGYHSLRILNTQGDYKGVLIEHQDGSGSGGPGPNGSFGFKFDDQRTNIYSGDHGASFIVQRSGAFALTNIFEVITSTGAKGLAVATGGGLSSSGDITAYSSDGRLKDNIKEIPNALEKVKQIKGVTFDWNDTAITSGFSPKIRYNDAGVIAQDIQKVLPQAVDFAPFDRNSNGNSISGNNYLTVKYEKIVPLLIEAIKEQQTQIEELKTIINGFTK